MVNDMAKVQKFNVNGKDLTAKEVTVLRAIKDMDRFVAASEMEIADYNTASIRSTMARLSKTHGLVTEKVALVEDKAVKTYAIADGIELPEDAE